jgi:hypothetical protein
MPHRVVSGPAVGRANRSECVHCRALLRANAVLADACAHQITHDVVNLHAAGHASDQQVAVEQRLNPASH